MKKFKIKYINKEDVSNYTNEGFFMKCIPNGYPVKVKDLIAGEIGMINGERIIIKDYDRR